MGRLSQLKFNPFCLNQNITFSGNNEDLDASFTTNNIKCNYYLPDEFRQQTKNLNR